jgi:hypothetical protein
MLGRERISARRRPQQRQRARPVRGSTGAVRGQRHLHQRGVDMPDRRGAPQPIPRRTEIAGHMIANQVPDRQRVERIDIVAGGTAFQQPHGLVAAAACGQALHLLGDRCRHAAAMPRPVRQKEGAGALRRRPPDDPASLDQNFARTPA